ncbi:unnamed protein product [Lymnaea stagnalis]|uniref:Uncharacterized protein n=1 Tax=Lymnaea stagnalis TaxID=6523 RepID=A0AAV2I2M4_LYMST
MQRSSVWLAITMFMVAIEDICHGQIITQGDCSCSCAHTNVTLTGLQLQKLGISAAVKIVADLTVDKQILSQTIRRKISIPDQRPSAKSIGYFGVVIMATVALVIVLMDVPHFFQMAKHMCKTVFKKKLV